MCNGRPSEQHSKLTDGSIKPSGNSLISFNSRSFESTHRQNTNGAQHWSLGVVIGTFAIIKQDWQFTYYVSLSSVSVTIVLVRS